MTLMTILGALAAPIGTDDGDITGYTLGKPVAVLECQTCGVVVSDSERHASYHAHGVTKDYVPVGDAEKETPEPTYSACGFKGFDRIVGPNGDAVRVYESAAGDDPHIWLEATDHAGGAEVGPAGIVRTTVHLSLDSARELRDQIDYLIKHHYRVDWPGLAGRE